MHWEDHTYIYVYTYIYISQGDKASWWWVWIYVYLVRSAHVYWEEHTHIYTEPSWYWKGEIQLSMWIQIEYIRKICFSCFLNVKMYLRIQCILDTLNICTFTLNINTFTLNIYTFCVFWIHHLHIQYILNVNMHLQCIPRTSSCLWRK